MGLIIQIYMIVCVAMLLFDLVFVFMQNRRTNSLFRINRQFSEVLKKEIALHRETGTFSEEFGRTLLQKLKKPGNMVTLQAFLEEDEEIRPWFRPAVMEQLETYRELGSHEQAYFAYLVTLFDHSEGVDPKFSAALASFLDSESLYVFSNTMNAFYRIGDVQLLLQAIDKADQRGRFYHKKLFVDNLLTSTVDHQALCRELLSRFDRYRAHTQDALLDYFRISRFDIAPLCLRLMNDSTVDSEVQNNAMRYFVRNPSEESKKVFLSILRNPQENWIRQMLAIQAMQSYRDQEVYDCVYSFITSRDWYVRTNAIEYLYRYGISKEQIREILLRGDRYANESLLYQYRKDEEITRFISDTLQELSSETHAAAPAAAGV